MRLEDSRSQRVGTGVTVTTNSRASGHLNLDS